MTGILKIRLSSISVDKMVKQGLLEEVSSFFEKNKDIYQDLGGETGIEKNRMWWIDDGDVNNHGIMQAIGLKEFIPYYCHNDGTGTSPGCYSHSTSDNRELFESVKAEYSQLCKAVWEERVMRIE